MNFNPNHPGKPISTFSKNGAKVANDSVNSDGIEKDYALE